MTKYLPPNLLRLFIARDPIEFKAPIEKPVNPPLTGIGVPNAFQHFLSPNCCSSSFPIATGAFVEKFHDPSISELGKDSKPVNPENKVQRKARKIAEKVAKGKERADEEAKLWNPKDNANATGDPSKTIFVGRIVFPEIIFTYSFPLFHFPSVHALSYIGIHL